MRNFSEGFLKEIDRIIDYETTVFWNRKGKHLRGVAFGYDISREDVKQELWLRLIDFVNKKFPDKGEEELLREYKGLLWHKVKISLIDIQRAWGYYDKRHVRIYKMARNGAGEEEIMEALNTTKQTISKAFNFRIYHLEDSSLPEDRKEEIKYDWSPDETYAKEEEEKRVFEIIGDGVLSKTEKQFIDLFLQGYQKKEIARKLGKSPSWATYTFKAIVRKVRVELELESSDCGNSSTKRKRKRYHKRGR